MAVMGILYSENEDSDVLADSSVQVKRRCKSKPEVDAIFRRATVKRSGTRTMKDLCRMKCTE
eukprot:2234766-Rhodomonas_salina.1